MQNKIKTIGIIIGIIVLISVGLGLGRWFTPNNTEVTDLRNQVASLREQITSLQERIRELEERTGKEEGKGVASCLAEEITPTGQTRLATVTYVQDGDTIKINGEEWVRYIGMNTPESGRPYFTEATNENKKLVNKKEVKLEFDVQTKDKYGRTLAYVWIGSTMVNLELVCRGYANVYTFPPNVKYADLFLKAERDAREHQRGLWMLSEISPPGVIKVVNINADAPGNDNENKNGEWVEIKNQGESSVNMTNWTLKDEANHIYTFINFTLAPDKSVFIYSGCGVDTQEKLYWQCPEGEYAIWNNTGDSAFLRDASGNLADSYKY